jgi:tetratricopeptide (TPR) repeat protein
MTPQQPARRPGKRRKEFMNYPRKIMRELAKSEELKVLGRYKEAIDIAQRILQKDPACVPAAEEIADNLLSLEEHASAEKTANFVLSLDPDSYIALYIKGFIALTRGENLIAVPCLSHANQKNPNNPEILRCLGWALFHTGKKTEGIATLERALNLRPDDTMILCDLGVCSLHENNFEKTIRLFERALVLDPENERAKECLEASKELSQKFGLQP